MLQIDSRTFNPEVLYIYEAKNGENNIGTFHHHSFPEISVILNGEAEYETTTEKFTAHAGTVLLFNPYVNHKEYQLTGTTSHQLHIGLRNIALEGYDRDVFPFHTSILSLGKEQHDFFEKCCKLLHEKNTSQLGNELMMKVYVMELVVLILRSGNEAASQPQLKTSATKKDQQNLVNNIIYYIETHHNEDISLETLSDKLYISSTYISKVFKQETGDSPINYLIKVRLNRAKQLLENQKVTVKEAAEIVGYQDAYHFSKLFKKHYGRSPSEFVKDKRYTQ